MFSMVCYYWYIYDSHGANHKRVSHYTQHENEFNLHGISFPVALKDIPKFEKMNNVSTSVYGYQEGKEDHEGFVYLLKVSKELNEC